MTLIRRKFDKNGDMQLNQFVTESEATMQATATRLRMFLKEFFLNTNEGTDYFGAIFTKPLNIGLAERTLKSRILQTDGVTKLVSFNLTFNAELREMTVDFVAEDEWGNRVTNEDIEGLNPLSIGS